MDELFIEGFTIRCQCFIERPVIASVTGDANGKTHQYGGYPVFHTPYFLLFK
jgi:hypothetical protein